ncbi:MAG: phenylacetate--CoA ligase family protein [Bryobacterales bacterium]|nr:phenylacetate--CoA ligase family protein [Bryobacterales bacterium]
MTGILVRFANSLRVARLAAGEARVAYLPEEVLLARQTARFQALVQFAHDRVPYYRAWMRGAGAQPGDLRSPADLARLPVVDKLDLVLQPEQFTAEGAERRDGLTLLSSGTSGRRRSFRHDTPALLEALAAGRRQRLALQTFLGRETAYREAVFNRVGSTGDQLRRFWESRTVNPAVLDLRRRLFSPALPFPRLLEEVNAFRPEVYRGIGSHLGAFLRWVLETGRPLVKPRVVTYGGDAMPAGDRRLIEEDLGIPVVSTYQAVEALRIGFQCEVRGGFHVSVDQVAVRVLDARGRDTAPGEPGELVLTNLACRATVVIHYRLGDIVTRDGGVCPCGRTLPLISNIDGRLDDLLVRPGGGRIHAFSVIPQLQSVPGLRQVQIVQKSMDTFHVRAVWARGAAAAPDALAVRMREVLGPAIQVTVEPVGMLPQGPGGKVKTVIREGIEP